MQNRSRFTPILFSLVATTLMAQETTGSVTGHVTTKAGKPIAGATVHIASPNLLGERIAVTDIQGLFRIPIIPGGRYTITASAKDFVASKGTFQVLAGQVSKADAVLVPVSEVQTVQSATVEVIASATQVDKTETVTQTNFAIEDINQLMSGNLDAVTYLAPGISNAGASPRIRGGSGNSTKFLLNGAMINDQAWGYDLTDTTIQDMIESVAVIQSPLNARYGNTDSGIVSMVTTKGTNKFAGSIRAKYNVGGMEIAPVSYNDRLGQNAGTYPHSDVSSRTYDVTVRGPIWKDHITFAFGGTYSPQTPGTTRMDKLITHDPASSQDMVGTYFKLSNGAVLRRANTYSEGQLEPNAPKASYNQFVLYWQVNTDHQIEWNYTQNDYRNTWYGYNPIDPHNGGSDGLTTKVWDLAYKGIIGTSGVLEARLGRTGRLWPHPVTATDPIQIRYGKTAIANADGTYVANSLYDLSKGYTSKWTNGATSDRGDNFEDTTFVLNYEHVLGMGETSLLVDVGMEQQKFQWDTQTLAQMPPTNFYAPGQLANNYTLAETGGIDPASVNGKFIVMNWQATNADAGGVGNASLYDGGKRYLIPSVRTFTGDPNGTYWQPSTSFYINGLWTLNKNQSIMAGLRSDTMKLQDGTGTLHSYSVLTPRFEYKWDILGDQSRLFNISYAQFHNRVPGGQFQQFVNRRLAVDTTSYWTGTAPTGNPMAPYLVDKSELENLANYGKVASYSAPGTFVLDSGWKAPIATEYTVGLRRSYASGMFWRATLIYKTWKNLYDTFPETTSYKLVSATDPNAFKWVYRRVTRNDPDSVKTYKGLELEWSIPFTAKLRFSGNYTYNRTMTNSASVNDSPSADRTPYGNFRNYYTQFYSRDAFNPIRLQDPEHNTKAWFVYDLSRPKVKSSISFLATYISGIPDNNKTSRMFIGYPGYYTGGVGTTGLRNYVDLVRTGFTMEATFSNSIKYDVEVELVRDLKGFISIEVDNPFNSRQPSMLGPDGTQYSADGSYANIKGYTTNSEPYNNPTYLKYGWRADTSNFNEAGGAGHRYDGRSFKLEAGLRF
jgi:hypothetical protein